VSCDDCLNDKSEDYRNCSVLYTILQLCTKHTPMSSSYRQTWACRFNVFQKQVKLSDDLGSDFEKSYDKLMKNS